MVEKNVRSFIAFDIDDPSIKNRFIEIQNELIKAGAKVKLVEPQNIHITLRFLGEIPKALVEKVKNEMVNIDFKAFDVEFKGLGAFPSLNRINVIWIGIKKGEEKLKEIFNQLENRLRKLGFSPDPKGFSPHITIARVKSRENIEKLIKILKEKKEHHFGIMKLDSLRLKKSTLTPKGPIYDTLLEVKAKDEAYGRP
ncbi:MAG: RNA 2',3'-cyclic phosphodiesterase [Candidatus Bathyarchaeia archaeon]